MSRVEGHPKSFGSDKGRAEFRGFGQGLGVGLGLAAPLLQTAVAYR